MNGKKFVDALQNEARTNLRTLFPVAASKPALAAGATIALHPFRAADDGISCVHCNLPRGNARHRVEPPEGDAA